MADLASTMGNLIIMWLFALGIVLIPTSSEKVEMNELVRQLHGDYDVSKVSQKRKAEEESTRDEKKEGAVDTWKYLKSLIP